MALTCEAVPDRKTTVAKRAPFTGGMIGFTATAFGLIPTILMGALLTLIFPFALPVGIITWLILLIVAPIWTARTSWKGACPNCAVTVYRLSWQTSRCHRCKHPIATHDGKLVDYA